MEETDYLYSTEPSSGQIGRLDGRRALTERGPRRRLLTLSERVRVPDERVQQKVLCRRSLVVVDQERLLEELVRLGRDVVRDRRARRGADLRVK